MIRRRNFITIVVIAVIATALATVAGVFAVQNVIGTKTVTASVTIQSLAESLKVCGTADSSCVGSVFTGDLGFGTMSAGATKEISFFVKNTEPSGGANIFIDARIDSGGAITVLTLEGITNASKLTGDAPNLGVFKIRRMNGTGTFAEDISTAIPPENIKKIFVAFTPNSDLSSGPKNFSILIDVVDTPD